MTCSGVVSWPENKPATLLRASLFNILSNRTMLTLKGRRVEKMEGSFREFPRARHSSWRINTGCSTNGASTQVCVSRSPWSPRTARHQRAHGIRSTESKLWHPARGTVLEREDCHLLAAFTVLPVSGQYTFTLSPTVCRKHSQTPSDRCTASTIRQHLNAQGNFRPRLCRRLHVQARAVGSRCRRWPGPSEVGTLQSGWCFFSVTVYVFSFG